MSCYYYNGELYHHGISGQKWGVRNGPPYPLDSGKATKSNAKRKLDTGKVSSKVKSTVSSVKNKISESRSASKEKKETKKEVETEKKKKISEMSDAELQKVVNRMKLENKYYKEASDLKKNTTSKGIQYVNKVKSKLFNAAFDTATDKAVEKIRKSVSDLVSSKKNRESENKDITNKENKESKNKDTTNRDKESKYKIKNYKVVSASPAKEFVDSLEGMNFTSAYQTSSTSYANNDTLDEMLRANGIDNKWSNTVKGSNTVKVENFNKKKK